MKRQTIIVEDFDDDSDTDKNSTEDYIEKLALQIQSRIDATTAQLERLTSPKSDDPTPDVIESVIANSDETMQQRIQQRSPSSGSYGKKSADFSPIVVDNEDVEYYEDEEMEQVKAEYQGEEFVTPQKGRLFNNDTMQTPDLSAIVASPLSTFGVSKLPKSPNGSVRRGTTQETFDRMYREAEAVKERKEQLRIVTENERIESVRKSSFIENYRNSPRNSRRGRSTSPTGSVGSASSGGYKRTPVRSNSANRLVLDPSQSDRMYYTQMEWMKEKDAHTERLKQQIHKDRMALEDVNLTLKPRLQTSAGMQVQRSQSSQEIFDVLYKSHQFYESKKEDLRQQLEDEFYAQNRFIPQITPRSKKIVSRRMQENLDPDAASSVADRLSAGGSRGYLFEEESAAGLGTFSVSTDAYSVASAPRSFSVGAAGLDSANNSGKEQPMEQSQKQNQPQRQQQPPKSPLYVMPADRLYGKSPNSRKNVKRNELRKSNERLLSSRGQDVSSTSADAAGDAIAQDSYGNNVDGVSVVPTVVEMTAAAVEAVPLSEKEHKEAHGHIAIPTAACADHFEEDLVEVKPPEEDEEQQQTTGEEESEDDPSGGLVEQFDNFRKVLADGGDGVMSSSSAASAVSLPTAGAASAPVVPTAKSPMVGADWNPFDFNSKHYRSRSPPTLLRSQSPSRYSAASASPSSGSKRRQLQQQYIPYSPNHRSTYRALRENGSIAVQVPVSAGTPRSVRSGVTAAFSEPFAPDDCESRKGRFSVGTNSYSRLQQQQHDMARSAVSASVLERSFEEGTSAFTGGASRRHVEGPYPSSASAYGDGNVSVVSERPRSAERGRSTIVNSGGGGGGGGASGRNSGSRLVLGIDGREVSIEEYYSRGRSRSRSPSMTRSSSAGRLRGGISTPNRRAGGAAGGDSQSGFSTPSRRSDSAMRRSVDSSEKSLFDRLYEARFESAVEMEECRARHTPTYTHQPDINHNISRNLADEDKEKDIFTRLYDLHNQKIVTEEADRVMMESQRLSEIAATSVRGGRVLKMTAEEETKTINRLLESKAKVESKVQHTKQEIDKSFNQMTQSRFIQPRSNSMASKAHSRALSEIFTVLCVTALHSADQQNETHPSAAEDGAAAVPSESSAEGQSASPAERQKVPSVLDVSLAQPHMLQPKVLADAMTYVLQSLVEQQKQHFAKLRAADAAATTTAVATPTKDQVDPATVSDKKEEQEESLPPLLVNRDQFIAEVLHHMATGALPPIGYILSQPERESKPVRQTNAARLMRSEDLAALKCKDKPELAAKKTTDVLVKGRYRLRRLGQEKVEDSLLSYVDFKEQKLYEKKVELEKEMKKICTFTPQLNEVVPSYLVRKQQQRQHQQQTSGAGKDGASETGSVRSGSVTSRGGSISSNKRSSSAPPAKQRGRNGSAPKRGAGGACGGQSEPAVVVNENVATTANSGSGTGYIEDYFLINTAPTMYHRVKSHTDKLTASPATSSAAAPHGTPQHHNHAAPAAVAAFHSSVVRGAAVASHHNVSSAASVSTVGSSSVSNLRSSPAARLQQPRPSSSAAAASHSYASAYDALRDRMRKDLYIDTSSNDNASVSNSVASGTVIRNSTPKASYVYSGNNRSNNVVRDAGSQGSYSTPGGRGDFSALYQKR